MLGISAVLIFFSSESCVVKQKLAISSFAKKSLQIVRKCKIFNHTIHILKGILKSFQEIILKVHTQNVSDFQVHDIHADCVCFIM
jgi:hypothetical protein